LRKGEAKGKLRELRDAVKDVKLRARVLERVSEFELNRRAAEDKWFQELVLCILTANSSFVSAYRAFNAISAFMPTRDVDIISARLREAGYRFYNIKARYIAEASQYYGKLKQWILPLAMEDQLQARSELTYVKGIGLKEASHFLRNVGFYDLAIVDRHVVDFVNAMGFNVKQPNSIRLYLIIEGILKSIASRLNLKVGILDLYLWYIETGTILK